MKGHDKVEGRQASSGKHDISSENFRPITASLIPDLLPFLTYILTCTINTANYFEEFNTPSKNKTKQSIPSILGHTSKFRVTKFNSKLYEHPHCLFISN